ncbi:MAG: energy-coupling factor transporter ATPase [Kandleria vitulina]|uniref:energy-coupling factor transporter ATPase n=1 Tax=Kandleria vitulina TaxID=1630 RepID=UPI002E78F48C|nr:energy-coupling factor transporter ATPase [Kandleria vitulina]MEE0989163.1 energy-coupling factor transporter ATPase [Kandleria vitulina]
MSITFENVEYIYGEETPIAYQALKGVNLHVEKGSFTALIGHTGSGKSTLIQHINALLIPSSGKVTIEDFEITHTKKSQLLKPLRKKAGLVFQFPEYQLFEETIEKDITFGPRNFGVSEEEAKQKARECLLRVGLDESYLERSPFELSGGQKRRVAIAGILAMDPDILVLDEPTAGLDPQGAKDMLDLFKDFQKSGKTVIMVSHDMNHVLKYCDHVIVMNKGQVEKHCRVEDLFKERDYLQQLSIDLPLMTDFIDKLNKNGFHIDHAINNMDDLIKEIGGELHE